MKVSRILILMAALFAVSQHCNAQTIVRRDSSTFRAGQLIAPCVLIGSGLAIHYTSHTSGIDEDIWQYAWETLRNNGTKEQFKIDDYIQYAPLLMDVGLGFTGVKSKHGFADRVLETALAYTVLIATSRTAKWAFDTTRPNGGDKSFPSGHSGTAFTGAELVRMEYGWGWGAGAYVLAVSVAGLRIYNNWHWFSDVLTGAGLGILSAHAGEWLLEPTKELLGIKFPEKWQFAVAPSIDPVTGCTGATLALRF